MLPSSPSPTTSPAAIAGQGAAGLDPTALALLSIFGGVLVTVLAGLLGAWLQSRREHTKWIREKRYDAYLSFIKVTHELRNSSRESDKVAQEANAIRSELDDIQKAAAGASSRGDADALLTRVPALTERLGHLAAVSAEGRARSQAIAGTLIDRAAAFQLLGPRHVKVAAMRVAGRDESTETQSERIAALERAMRKALGVKE